MVSWYNNSSVIGRVLGSRINKIKPAWRYTPGGTIWRIVPTSSGKMIGESRDLQGKQVSFFCVNQKTGEVLWEGPTFGEQWWIGIEAVHRETLLLHKFATPELPEHQSIIAVDVLTGKELWRDGELKFESMNEEALYSSRRTMQGNRQYLRLDYRTGEILGEVEDENILYSPTLELENLDMPQPLLDLTTCDSPTNIAVRRHCNVESLAGPVECIELPGHFVFSCYEHTSPSPDNRLNNVLKVLDRGRDTLLFSEVICRNSSAATPENFFVHGDMIFFVRDRTTLTAIGLW